MALGELRGSRLRLLPASPDHMDLFAELNSDPAVMRHVSGRPASRIETETEWKSRLGSRSAVHRGLGYWTGYLDSQFIGWWGLGFQDAHEDAGELGFRIQRRHWRRGFGLEGARLVVEHGFAEARINRIWAGTVTANEASRATLSRLGMVCTDEPAPGILTYEVTLMQWLERADGP